MNWLTALHLYGAFLIVMVLHELGHLPGKIQVKWWGPFPVMSAMHASFRLGGPLVNLILAIAIARLQPANLWIVYIGLLAFVHLLLYTVLGSLLPEPRPGTVDVRTHVFDDFDNAHAGWFLTGAFVLFLALWPYYGPIAKGVFT